MPPCPGGELFDHIAVSEQLHEAEARDIFKQAGGGAGSATLPPSGWCSSTPVQLTLPVPTHQDMCALPAHLPAHQPAGRTPPAQVAEGVAHLHSLGIAHRDLKPQNLMYASADAGAQVGGRSAVRGITRATPGARQQAGALSGGGGALQLPLPVLPRQLPDTCSSGRSSTSSETSCFSRCCRAAQLPLPPQAPSLSITRRQRVVLCLCTCPGRQVKIMDYDLARVNYSPNWEGGTPCGTLHYM